MISVVTPLYNKEKQIVNTLHSVLRQTFQDFEFIIVDDGSTDRSVEEIEKVYDARIRIIHQTNAGVSAARNRGIEEAKYELVAFLDADDEWMPEYLATQYSLHCKYPECSVYVCNYAFQDAYGEVVDAVINKLSFHEEDGVLDNYFEVATCSHPPLWTSAVMVKKEAIQSIGGFPVGIKSGEDLLTWARLAVSYRIAYSRSCLCHFIIDEANYDAEQRARLPDRLDYVGKQLLYMLSRYSNVKGLDLYIALWYKMRAKSFLLRGYSQEARKNVRLSMKLNLTWKILVFYILSFFPSIVIYRVLR